jgi:hypothetical protein
MVVVRVAAAGGAFVTAVAAALVHVKVARAVLDAISRQVVASVLSGIAVVKLLSLAK